MGRPQNCVAIRKKKQLEKCENKLICEFILLLSNLPDISDEIRAILSTEQKYLYEIVQSVASGYVSYRLRNTNPGKIAHSRWLTTAIRISRYYVAEYNPTEELSTLARYLVKVYAPGWFLIKKNEEVKDGARNLHQILVWNSEMPKEVVEIVRPTLQRNAYFAHPENLLLE